MANLNKVMLIGRLTRDPVVRTFASGGKVANFGFAVNNRKKNPATGQWEDEPVFIDIEAFNRGEKGRQLADLVEQYMHKGHQFYLEGHLRFDQWTKDGQKMTKLKVVLEDFQFLEPRSDGGGMGRPAPAKTSAPAPDEPYDSPVEASMEPMAPPRQEEDIPF
ncbi:MAG TPA: single-stranded DNA-binding protein [Gemmataceae bacterium]|nr:single-stranded DNA-binding protein [Gemmataceae bacterium]